MAATKAETVMLKLDEQIAGAADRATGALGRLENQIAREQNALGRLDQSLALAKNRLTQIASGGDKGVVDIAEYKRQQMAVGALGDKIGAQKDKIVALGEKSAAAKGKAEQLGGALKLVGDKAGISSSQTAQLAASLAELGPYGAAAAAALLIMGGAVAVVVGIIAKGISAASELRGEFLKLKAETVTTYGAMSWLYNGMVASNAAATTMENAINRVSVGTARSREELMGYASQIRAARFSGKDFETVLRTMAIAGAGGMKERPGQFLAMAQAARMTGRSIDDLAARIKKGLGVVAEEELLGIDVQLKKLHENLTWIFGGADIDPLLSVLHGFLSLLNMGSPTATSLRDAITLLVETAINKFLKLTIVLLKTYIWIKEHALAWGTLKVIVMGVAIAFGVLAAAVLLVLTVSTALLAISAVPFVVMGAAIYGVIRAVKALWSGFPNFSSVGSNIIDGIVSGIKAAGSAIWGALKNIIGGAIDSVKDFLGISSPSKLFRDEVGQQMAAGTAAGVEEGGGEVAAASTKMAGGAVGGAKAAANDNAAPASGGGRIFNFYGCDFGETTEDTVRKMMHRVLETESLDAAVPA